MTIPETKARELLPAVTAQAIDDLFPCACGTSEPYPLSEHPPDLMDEHGTCYTRIRPHVYEIVASALAPKDATIASEAKRYVDLHSYAGCLEIKIEAKDATAAELRERIAELELERDQLMETNRQLTEQVALLEAFAYKIATCTNWKPRPAHFRRAARNVLDGRTPAIIAQMIHRIEEQKAKIVQLQEQAATASP